MKLWLVLCLALVFQELQDGELNDIFQSELQNVSRVLQWEFRV